ncbi:amidohydrolase family protein [Andreprevotia chitinilytica]|uniref:amidohydrolase family protein n=1 Tax=Andreprevotia chitinilytica TaxID=396808 RepID=UPI00055002B6|nr:amidohydrolase family protein [Andreprevotia chitinilytica]
MQVVDPHIHLWDLSSQCYPWMESETESFSGDITPIRRNYLVADLLADAAAGGIEVLKTVHVEANHADPLAETSWLQSVADDPANRNMPNAIVAAVDFSVEDAEPLLAAHCEFKNVRGVRQILNVHDNPYYDYVGRQYMSELVWRRNLKLLAKFGLSFDLQLYPSQMPLAMLLARDSADTQFVINHAGMFVDRNTTAGWREWRDGLALLATNPNVAIKISGLGMFDHRWTVESLRPYVLQVIDTFGPERCLFASNFPVDRLYGSYSALWRAYADIVSGFSASEQAMLFRENAERIYRI